MESLGKLREKWSIILAVGVLFISDFAVRAQDFGYDGHNGPQHWAEQYGSCVGKHQSPININLLAVKEVQLPPIQMDGFDVQLEGMSVNNNGHTLMVKTENQRAQPQISGGPLFGDYVFNQFHFHWGDNDSVGSEDRINSRSFPMELHMVFYKKEYGDPIGALDHKDGLAVLAFFYEVDRHRHPMYDVITNALPNVTEPQTSVSLTQTLKLIQLLPYDLERYFTYNGSLTTPPCSEVVTWIDFEQPIRISHDQISSFRELRSDHGHIKHNFRPTQPLGDRTVFYNSDRGSYYDNTLDEAPTPSQNSKGKNSGADYRKTLYEIIFLAIMAVTMAVY